MSRWAYLLVAWGCAALGGRGVRAVREVREWAELEYVFPGEAAARDAVAKGYYAPGLPVPPVDVDVYYGNGRQPVRMFVTVPRWGPGRPVTLGTLDARGRLVPYPNYSWHDAQGDNCNGMTSVFRVAIDECQRLWVLDNGAIGSEQLCPPQLLAFDLSTDQLLFRHRFDPQHYINSIFVTPVVDVRGGGDACLDTFVYVADVRGPALLVVDVANNRSWRVVHRLLYPCPYWGFFSVDGESFELMDGVLGLALSPLSSTADRLLYFHSLASVGEGVISTATLRNSSAAETLISTPQYANIQMLPGSRASQSAAEAMDRNGILFFGSMEPPAIYCWNSATVFSQQNFHQVAVNSETLQFASGMKVVDNAYGEQELWVLTSSLQRFMAGTLTSARPNFRIHAEKISNLLRNSPCLYSQFG